MFCRARHDLNFASPLAHGRAAIRLLFSLGLALTTVCVLARPVAAGTLAGPAGLATPLTTAEAGIAQFAQGDYAGAARKTRQALDAVPDEAAYHALAGALLLDTGDPNGAKRAFETALACAPDDSLARYGLGLTLLARGDANAALACFDRAERDGGDRSYLLLARRYAQWLGGAQVVLADAGLPDAFGSAQHALQGMTAARLNNPKAAVAQLQTALDALPGDPLVQPGGLLMTFETGGPLATSARALPAGHGLDAPLPSRADALSGDIALSPGDLSGSAAYVSYDLDGQPLALVNVRPFVSTWDTRTTGNGWHTLTITQYDRDANPMAHVTRRVRTANRGGLARSERDAERLERVRAGLWQALSLRPDRCVCAYTMGLTYRARNDLAGARRWFARAAAINPDFRDTRRQMLACGGLEAGGEALWGGTATEKIVALTFDDGPRPGLTEPLLDVLTAQQVPATFFVIGRHVTEYPELTRRIVDAGMELANHSYTHPNLTRLSETAIAQEMMQTQAAIQAVAGRTPRYMRPPGGNWNDRAARVTRQWGLTPCFWTVDVYGSEVIGAQQVADAVLAQVRPGSIILMHNGKLSTLQALPTIIRELRARGYTFATVDTMARRLNLAREASRSAAHLAALAAAHRTE